MSPMWLWGVMMSHLNSVNILFKFDCVYFVVVVFVVVEYENSRKFNSVFACSNLHTI